MPLHQTLSALAFLSLTAFSAAAPDPKFSGQTCPTGYERQIEWINCGGTGDEKTSNAKNLECATLDVPLDYEFPSDTTKVNRIPLIRIPRKKEATGPRKAIIYNPGGPGVAGISSLALYSMPNVWASAEGNYDVVTFDPRGVGLSNPFTNLDGTNTNYRCRNEVSDRSYETDAEILAMVQDVKDQGAACNENPINNWGGLVGSAFVARDIVAITNAVNEDKLIRYYGASYGTLLGATLAQMFPLQLDRVVLDGNINPIDYYYGLGDEAAADTNRAVTNFFQKCVENVNKKCALTDGSYTAKDLQDKWDQWLDILYQRPTRDDVKDGKTVTIPKYQEWRSAKEEMNNNLFEGPGDAAWVLYAEKLYKAFKDAKIDIKGPTTKKMKREQTAANQITYQSSKDAAAANRQILQAVTCGDYVNPDGYTASEKDFKTTLKAWKDRSTYMYDNYIKTQLTCYGWQTPAKERYYPRSGKTITSADILFVQTLYDPVTPEISATNSMNTFANAGILKHTGVGHCSNRDSSDDLDSKVKQYWSSGKVPAQAKPDTPNVPNPFDYDVPKNDQTDTVDQVGGNGADDGSDTASVKKRGVWWEFPRHLLEKPLETSQLSRRQIPQIFVGCKPVGATTTSSSSTSSSTMSSTTTSESSTTTTQTTSSTSSSSTSTTTASSTTTGTSSTSTTSDSSTSTVSTTPSSTITSTSSTSISSTSGSTTSGSFTSTSTSTGTGTVSTSTTKTSTSTTGSPGTTGSTTTTSGSTSISTTGTASASTTTNTLTTGTGSTTYTYTYTTGTYTLTSGTYTLTTSNSQTTSSSKSWTTQTRSSSYTSKPTWATGDEWLDWSSTTTRASTKPSWATGDEWSDWGVATTTTKPDPTAAWGNWNTGSDYKTFTKTSTIVSTISKCPPQITGCKDVVSSRTVTITTVYPTITIYKTDVVELCSTGLTSKPITITETCKDGCSARPTGAPPGYTVTKVWCDACATPAFVEVTSTVYVYGGDGNSASTKAPAAATPVSWDGWNSNGATTKPPAAATPASGTWGDWNGAGSNGATKTPDAASPSSSSWNTWDAAGSSASKTPAAATGVKTYTGAATKQVISVSTLLAGLVAVMLL